MPVHAAPGVHVPPTTHPSGVVHVPDHFAAAYSRQQKPPAHVVPSSQEAPSGEPPPDPVADPEPEPDELEAELDPEPELDDSSTHTGAGAGAAQA